MEQLKQWRVFDYGNGMDDEFDTEEEAVAFAQQSLELYRDEAKSDGEWCDEVESLSVYKLAHCVQILKETESGIDYEIRKAP